MRRERELKHVPLSPERVDYRDINVTRLLFEYYLVEAKASIEDHMSKNPSLLDYHAKMNGKFYSTILQLRARRAEVQRRVTAFLRKYLLIAVNAEMEVVGIPMHKDPNQIRSFYTTAPKEEIVSFFFQAATYFQVYCNPDLRSNGQKWTPIAQAGKSLWEKDLPSAQDIEYAITLTHNSNCLFNKDPACVVETWAGVDDRKFLNAHDEFISVLEMIDFMLDHARAADAPRKDVDYLLKQRSDLLDFARLLESQTFLKTAPIPILGKLQQLLLAKKVTEQEKK